MGCYLNPGKKGFRESLNSAIYVDKTKQCQTVKPTLDTRLLYVNMYVSVVPDDLENLWQRIC